MRFSGRKFIDDCPLLWLTSMLGASNHCIVFKVRPYSNAYEKEKEISARMDDRCVHKTPKVVVWEEKSVNRKSLGVHSALRSWSKPLDIYLSGRWKTTLNWNEPNKNTTLNFKRIIMKGDLNLKLNEDCQHICNIFLFK